MIFDLVASISLRVRFDFFYDETGDVIGFKYDGVPGALVANTPGAIKIIDVVEVGFK